MSEKRPVNTAEYWAKRVSTAKDPRRMMWDASDEAWERMEQEHRLVLAEEIKPDDRILDAGCGYGRLLDLLPLSFRGVYVGVDISPELIVKARELYHEQMFLCLDLSELPPAWTWRNGLTQKEPFFDVAVCAMLRHMLTTHVGAEYWAKVEAELRRVAKRLLILEPREVL